MYFDDRVSLGKRLANETQEFKGNDAVIVCLQESSLLTCLSMAMELHAWVYPLLYSPVYSQDLAHSLIGVHTDDGTFIANKDEYGKEFSLEEHQITIQSNRQTAIRNIQSQIEKYEIIPDKHCMQDRDVLLVADVLTNTMPIVLVNNLLQSIRPKSLTVLAGNVTPQAAEELRRIGDDTIILDILSGMVFDPDHYFEHDDAYSLDQKYKLTHHIATYWH